MAVGPLLYLVLGALVGSLFLLGLLLAFVGLRGQPVLDDPRCAGCGYDLTQPGKRPERCPECGRDLTRRGSVRFDGRVRRPALWVPGLLLAALALLSLPSAQVASGILARRAWTAQVAAPAPAGGPLATAGPQEFATMTLPVLVDAIPAAGQGPWIWQELEKRLAAGAIGPESAARIAVRYREAIAAAGGDATALGMWPNDFTTKLVQSGQLDDEGTATLADALLGEPDYGLPARVVAGGTVAPVTREHGHLLPFRRVQRVRAVRLDGEPVASDAAAPPARMRRAFGAFPPLTFDQPGDHVIEIDAEWLLVPNERSARRDDGGLLLLLDREDLDAQALRQHGVVAARRATIRHHVAVLPPGVSLIEPIVDADQRSAVAAAVQVVACRVVRVAGGGLRLDLDVEVTPIVGVPLLLGPAIQIGDLSLTGRPFATWTKTPGSRTSSGSSSWTFELEGLPDDVTSLRLTLEPQLDRADFLDKITKAWGEPIVIENVAVTRTDLKR